MDTKCKEDEPFYRIDGDFTEEGCTDILYIGYVSEVHYQSLLIDYTERSTQSEALDENVAEEESFEIPFVEDQEEEMEIDYLEEKFDTDDGPTFKEKITQERDDICPSCRKTFKNLIMHIKRSKKCKISDSDLRNLEEKSKNIRKEKVKVNKRNCMVKNRNDKIKRREKL